MKKFVYKNKLYSVKNENCFTQSCQEKIVTIAKSREHGILWLTDGFDYIIISAYTCKEQEFIKNIILSIGRLTKIDHVVRLDDDKRAVMSQHVL